MIFIVICIFLDIFVNNSRLFFLYIETCMLCLAVVVGFRISSNDISNLIRNPEFISVAGFF